jgi:NADH:ubiquinone reductase (H+-translocating)
MARSSDAAPRVVVVGAGFAGFHAARGLSRRLAGAAEIVVVNSTDYFLYLPLLPEVAAGVLDPRRVAVSLAATLPGVRLRVGEVDAVDLDARRVSYTDSEGGTHQLGYDRLVLAVGSVNKLLPIPGVAAHAHGFRGIAEALYVRDHIIRQVELAAFSDRNCGRRAVRLWWSALATPALRSPLKACCSPRNWPGGIASWLGSRCAGCCWIWPRGCCRSWIPGCR